MRQKCDTYTSRILMNYLDKCVTETSGCLAAVTINLKRPAAPVAPRTPWDLYTESGQTLQGSFSAGWLAGWLVNRTILISGCIDADFCKQILANSCKYLQIQANPCKFDFCKQILLKIPEISQRIFLIFSETGFRTVLKNFEKS